MFKIQRSAEKTSVIFTLSGRIKAERLAELEKLMECEIRDHNLVLDLRDVKIVDREAIGFLADCEANGVRLANCPAYIREWIEREADPSKGPRGS